MNAPPPPSPLRALRRAFKRRVRALLLGEHLAGDYPPDIPEPDRAIIASVWPVYTMTLVERVYTLIEVVRYLEDHAIPGAFVECGVWRGGSMMAAATTLLQHRGPTRDLWLYDTFEGMSVPTTHDRDFLGRTATDLLSRTPKEARGVWCVAGRELVRLNMLKTGYPAERMQLVEGKVEHTIPTYLPEQIALLRLDTDWYESTKHELIHGYPRLSRGGVLILDDYGHWQGARQAVDEYFASLTPRPFLHRIDYGARLAFKP